MSQAVKFRKARAAELKTMANTLDNLFGSTLGSKRVNTSPIYTAANQLENNSLADSNDNLWGYEIKNFKLPVDTLRHVRPKEVKNVELTLNMKLIADLSKWGAMDDPFIDLAFHVTLKSVNLQGASYMCFHIDKHDMSKNSEEPHPIYHLQYNPKPKNFEEDEFDYGNVLYLDTPRLPFHPLDFALGLGFIISSFNPQKWDGLMGDRFFKRIYKAYQENILKPYNHSLADHWKPFDSDKINWTATNQLCPYLV